MKKYLFLLIITAICYTVNAQTFYEVKYFDQLDNREYLGLMTYWDNEDCTIRCVPFNNDEEGYWECDYGVNFDKEDGINYMIFYPMVEEDDNDENVSFPYFIWTWTKRDASDQNESPYVVFDIDDMDDEMVTADHFAEIDLKDMNKEYISQFYEEDEEMYEIISSACNLVNEQGNTPVADNNTVQDNETSVINSNSNVTMHFIMAAATLDETIGDSVSTDLNLAKFEFKNFAKQLNINYKEYIFADKNFNRRNITNAINSIKPKKDDIIVFIYSGHGFRFDDDTDEYPNMALKYSGDINSGNYLGVSEVYNTLVKKKSRLTIVLSDCCNSYYGATRREVDSSSLCSRGTNNYDLKKLEKLFLNTSGSIKVTAAKPGQYALCDAKGGFLLTSFLTNIHSSISPVSTYEVSWNTIIDNAREYVKRKTTGYDETGKDTDPQIVVRSVNIR